MAASTNVGMTETFADVLKGGASVDILDGGAGPDWIKDWEDGLDRIDLTALNIDYFSARASATETSGGHLSIDLSPLGRIVIESMTLDQLTQDDFV